MEGSFIFDSSLHSLTSLSSVGILNESRFFHSFSNTYLFFLRFGFELVIAALQHRIYLEGRKISKRFEIFVY